jgi:hypothetical protein
MYVIQRFDSESTAAGSYIAAEVFYQYSISGPRVVSTAAARLVVV